MRANGPERRRRRSSGRGQSPSPASSRWRLRLGRRETLTVLGAGFVGGLSGCLSEPSFPDADVIAGADGRNIFEPPEVSVRVGDTVTWGFASAGHNICCRPTDSNDARLPTDAAAFASYGPDESSEGSLVPRGETYEHTFDVPGRYHYVCIPHERLDMAGTVHVE